MSDEAIDRANERGRKVLQGLMTVEQANAEAAAETTKAEPKKKTTTKPAPEA